MRLRHLLPTVTAAALLTLTACSASTTPAPKTTTTVAPHTTKPTTAATPDMTQLVVDVSWAQQSDADKDAMCQGIALFGPAWAAKQMRQGAGDESVDWDRAAQLVADKCANR